MTKLELQNALRLPQFPRSAHYDIDWMVEHEMGPCALWLTEFLVDAMNLQSGMRVLDLGCGKALSSIFLANEFDVQVWATDLWIPASENWGRIVEAKMEHHVFPISAEAHALPYAQGFFDAIVSVDSYHYYGTDELYLGYLARFVKPEGEIGIIVPGVHEEWTPAAIDRFGEYWDAYNYTFHGPEWWKQLWERSKCVQVTTADVLFRGYEIWLQWDKTLRDAGLLKRRGDVEMLELDGGNLTFTRIVASRV